MTFFSFLLWNISPIEGLTLSKAWLDIGKYLQRTPGVSYVAISRDKSLSSCVIEPMNFERLDSLKSSKTLQFRLDGEAKSDCTAYATCTATDRAQQFLFVSHCI